MPLPKKKVALKTVKRKKSAATTGLATSTVTPSEHLLRQFSLRYFVDKSMKLKEVARKLNVPKKQIELFFDDPEYVQELEERMERVLGVDTQFMQNQAQISLVHLYEEMRRREIEGELKDISMRDLHKMLVDTQKEMRLDTPGAFTSKVGVADLGDLQGRYEKSLSGKIHRKRALKNVTPEKKQITKGSKSRVEESKQDTSGGSQ